MIRIINQLEQYGPQTGNELAARTNMDLLCLWQACHQSSDIVVQTIGTRYLRIDKHVEGLARLSPSILREFCNYSVISLSDQASGAQLRAEHMEQSMKKISKNKFDLAHSIMEQVIKLQEDPDLIMSNVCFMIAGDVAYTMAHVEERPEFSTGRMVNGSDLDVVIVYKDIPEHIVKSLDAAVYDKKYSYLCHPAYKEEIDYVIKNLAKVDKQLDFDSLEAMIASKVLNESQFLCGSYELYTEIKAMVVERKIPEYIASLEIRASTEREHAKIRLLAMKNGVIEDKEMGQLFYTTDEREEFF